MHHKRKIRILFSCMLLCVCILVGGTIAFMSIVIGVKANEFHNGVVNIEVTEEFLQEDIRTDLSVDKEVRILNSDADGRLNNIIPLYVRVRLAASWKEGESILPVDVDSFLQYDLNLSDDSKKEDVWVKGDDGYYYYTGIVNPKEATKVLLNRIWVEDKNSSQLPEEGYLEVQVLADAIQATTKAANEAWNNPCCLENKIYE